MKCAGTTKKGNPCAANALKDTDRCLAHSDEETRETVGFGGSQEGAGRPKNPRAVDVLRERLEEDIDRVLAPLFNGLEADRGIALAVKGGGMEIGYAADHETRIRAARELLDRAYGRPRQSTEITGPEGGPLQVEGGLDLSRLSLDEKRALVALLEKAEADAGPDG